MKYNDEDGKNRIKELFDYIISYEIDLNDNYAYSFDKTAKY